MSKSTYHITVEVNLSLTKEEFEALRLLAGQTTYGDTMFKIIKSKTKGTLNNPIVSINWLGPTKVMNTGVIEPTNLWLKFNLEDD